jgi:hypothetical protein
MLCPLTPYFKFVNSANMCSNKRQPVLTDLAITEAGLNSQLNPLSADRQTDRQTCGTTQGTFTPQLDKKIGNETRSINIYFLWRRQTTDVLWHFECNQIWYTIRQLFSHIKGLEYLNTSCTKHRATWKNHVRQIYIRNAVVTPIVVAARSKAWVCGRSLAEVVGSNPAGGMDVCLLWLSCVVR